MLLLLSFFFQNQIITIVEHENSQQKKPFLSTNCCLLYTFKCRILNLIFSFFNLICHVIHTHIYRWQLFSLEVLKLLSFLNFSVVCCVVGIKLCSNIEQNEIIRNLLDNGQLAIVKYPKCNNKMRLANGWWCVIFWIKMKWNEIHLQQQQ